jgi:hypothetical protein
LETIPEGIRSLFPVIEVQLFGADQLIFFMPFTGEQDNITRFGHTYRQPDGFSTGSDRDVTLFREPAGKFFFRVLPQPERQDAGFNFSQNHQWIFGARIIRSYYCQITVAPGYFTHKRPFPPITISTAAEYGYYPAFGYLKQGLEHVFKRIIRRV